MDPQTCSAWLTEPRAIPVHSGNMWRTWFVDNCTSHIENESTNSLEKVKIYLRKLVSTARN